MPKDNQSICMNEPIRNMTVCGYEFNYIQNIEPKKNENGAIIEYQPQVNYSNSQGRDLHKYGKGSFCKFTITAENLSGVYLWVVDDEIIYIGRTKRFRTRFNSGYGTISGRNCYKDGQVTNCKMNKVALELSRAGKRIQLYFFKTDDYVRVEQELLATQKTKYNSMNNK